MLSLNELIQTLEKIKNIEELEQFQKDVLWKKWSLNEEFKKMKELDGDQRKVRGQELAEIKNKIMQLYQKKEILFQSEKINKKLQEDLVDISITKSPKDKWYFSLLAKVRREVEEISKSFGFIIEYGNEVVSKFENFESVNIPLTHPATEMHDTIYLQEKDDSGENFVLRTHTSSSQNYLIKKYWVPLKAVIPGKVYRYENLDTTHDTMFYQLEWLVIDKNISIAHLKDMLTKLLSAILQSDVEIRMRPAYFPFVEPGFEVDARYDIYDQKTWKTSKSKWIEILWAGMIHPNVLKNADIDPKERKGFAFGIGINRVAAMRYGIKDIRYFTNGDLRFSKSFW